MLVFEFDDFICNFEWRVTSKKKYAEDTEKIYTFYV